MSINEDYYNIFKNIKCTNLQADPTKNYEIIFNILGEENNNQLNGYVGLRSILINTDYNPESPINYLVNIKIVTSIDKNKVNFTTELTKTLSIDKGIELTGNYILEQFYKNEKLYSLTNNTLALTNNIENIEPCTRVISKYMNKSYYIYTFQIKKI